MKRSLNRWMFLFGAVFGCGIGGLGTHCLAVPPRDVAEGVLSRRSTTGSGEVSGGQGLQVAIEAEAEDDDQTKHKDVAWLGVSTLEASETLSSQLELPAGAGLVITYVAHESGAAKAGLQKHDVLVEFEDQSLVHPAQLRKLVRTHKPGDTIKVAYYRTGKRTTTEVTLGKFSSRAGGSEDDQLGMEKRLRDLKDQLKGLDLDVAIREQMKSAREAFGSLNLDQKKVQEELRESMEQARTAIREALKNSTNSDSALKPLRKVLEDLAGTAVSVGNNTTVTVRSSGKESKSVVNADETGTIVLVANPKLHLTAHDKEGKLVFDGPIETDEERDEVPRDLWKKVQPLVEKMNAGR